MASAGAHCNHVNHVSTQLPYAMLTAAVCAVGYLIAGLIGYYADSPVALVASPVTLLMLAVVVAVASKRHRQRLFSAGCNEV